VLRMFIFMWYNNNKPDSHDRSGIGFIPQRVSYIYQIDALISLRLNRSRNKERRSIFSLLYYFLGTPLECRHYYSVVKFNKYCYLLGYKTSIIFLLTYFLSYLQL